MGTNLVHQLSFGDVPEKNQANIIPLIAQTPAKASYYNTLVATLKVCFSQG